MPSGLITANGSLASFKGILRHMLELASPRKAALIQPSAPTKKGTFFVQTWGCQMNEEDSEQLSLQLQSIGFVPTENLVEAHVVLLNTCSVRKKPEDKAFSMLGELEILKRLRPDMVIGVCGCMAQIKAKEIRERARHVDFILGTGDLGQVVGLVEESLQQRKFRKRMDLPERKGSVVTDVPQRSLERRVPKLKAYVPIQYGCDKFCTYCIVPSTRGRERSRPTEDILEEVRTLAKNGTKEITLLGQTVNSYGKNLLEGRVPFAKLLEKLSEIDGLERIRYTSPYPRDFKDDLIQTIRDNPKVMEHVHMPLQAGDDEVLAQMKRAYTTDDFRRLIDKIRSTIPGICITTDLIVGFPGETDAQFERGLNFIREMEFDSAYMFLYSPRPMTPACDMEQVPQTVKQERHRLLFEAQNEITERLYRRHVGETLEVLVDSATSKGESGLKGHARDSKLVTFNGNPDRIGRICKVKITDSHTGVLKGEIA